MNNNHNWLNLIRSVFPAWSQQRAPSDPLHCNSRLTGKKLQCFCCVLFVGGGANSLQFFSMTPECAVEKESWLLLFDVEGVIIFFEYDNRTWGVRTTIIAVKATFWSVGAQTRWAFFVRDFVRPWLLCGHLTHLFLLLRLNWHSNFFFFSFFFSIHVHAARCVYTATLPP